MAAPFLASFGVLVVAAFSIASATDPNQLDDFCVAPNNLNNAMLVQGKMCKNPSEVTADDFLFRGLNEAGDTNNPVGVNLHVLDTKLLPGLNTLGITVGRIDIAASGGIIPPHIHPWATEVLIVVEGTFDAGFVSFNNSDNSAKLFSKVLRPGDVFVLPQGLAHFAYNGGDTNAVVLAAYSSQNSGFTAVAPALFGAQPPVSGDLLSKAFKLDPAVVKDLQSKF